MGAAVGAVLAFAVGVGVSPIPIVAVILVLFSERAAVNGPLFLVGWLAGLTTLTTAAYLTAAAFDVGSSADAADGVAILKTALGILLLVAAVRKWRNRPGPDTDPTLPAWTDRIDRSTPRQALVLGAALSANPKNIALSLGAGSSLAALAPSVAEAVAGVAAFVVVGSAAVATAVTYHRLGGDHARDSLDRAKAWLTLHNQAVMAVLFVVFGAVLVSQGLGLRS